LKTDLEENGLMLESVSILTLRAAKQGSFGTDDIFGAQVARANAQVIQQALKERNDIERKTEIEIKQRDISTAKQRLDLDRDLALASATQEREVRMMQATEKANADQKVFEEAQKSELARVSKERAIALAEMEREQQIGIQNERKQQEILAAEVIRRQALELAEQQRQINVLQEQQKRTTSEKELYTVAAQREEANQAVKTVEATQQAQREAKIRVIEAERDAQKSMIEQKNRIELEALRKQREAQAQAGALKEIAAAEAEAALKQADTLRTQAAAEREAEQLRADGMKAKTSAAGLAEADVLKAKADAAMREAEAVKARGLAEAESVKAKGLAEAEAQKSKAEALAAYDGVVQRVEITKLQLDAQVQIEVAKAQALGNALASMNIKLIGDPTAASQLLKMVTFADGLGEVAKAAPLSVREIGQQLLNKATGVEGDSLIKINDGDGKAPQTNDVADLALLVPELMKIAERTLDMNKLKGQSVAQVLTLLAKQAPAADKPAIEKAQKALASLPIINDLPFEEVYLRATTK
jgi:uncharacterized membrane protein YqiK